MKTCERCGTPFEPSSSSTRNPNYQGRYCSRVCANKARAVPAVERFWQNVPYQEVLIDGRVTKFAPAGGCWEWQGPCDRDGYGVMDDDAGHQVRAHRVSYQELLYRQPLPARVRVLHGCDNRRCVNPVHLFLGTDADNMADRDAKGRQAKGERHGRTRLTEQDVRVIRAAVDTSQQELATQYGISQVAVSLIRRRKTWRHVE